MNHDIDGLAEIPILQSHPETFEHAKPWSPGLGLLFSVAICGVFWGSIVLFLWRAA